MSDWCGFQSVLKSAGINSTMNIEDRAGCPTIDIIYIEKALQIDDLGGNSPEIAGCWRRIIAGNGKFYAKDEYA
jgi:hypothetical protein